MEIKGFIQTSFIDYPGKVAAVIWIPGCNFRCPFCYNVDLVLNPSSLPSFSEAEILNHLKKERKFLDGLVVTGGEPTRQPDLPDFLTKVKAEKFLVKLDTNGSQTEIIQKLISQKLVDYIALDIKAPFRPEKYCQAAGLNAQNCVQVLQNLTATVDLLLSSEVEYELRTTVVPGLSSEDDFMEIGRFCKAQAKYSVFPGRYVIQNFFPASTLNPEFTSRKPWEKERLNVLQKDLRPFFREVIIRSRES